MDPRSNPCPTTHWLCVTLARLFSLSDPGSTVHHRASSALQCNQIDYSRKGT